MEPPRPSIPILHLQPPSVDFIENRLQGYHPAFAMPPSQYNPDLGIFVICQQQACPASAPLAPTNIVSTEDAINATPTAMTYMASPRPLAEPTAVLKFWDSFFNRAMEQFKSTHPEEPKEIANKCCGIRDKSDWTTVFDQLEAAQQNYCKVDKGAKARLRKVYRNFADRFAKPLLGASKFVPNIDYVTPVLGIVQILLEAFKIASEARTEFVNAFDGIDMKFQLVEMSLELFTEDQNIDKASTNLIAAVFYAIECAIDFFLKSTWKKGFSATTQGKEHQKVLRDALNDIQSKSATLMEQTEMSDKYAMRSDVRQVLDRTSQGNSKLERISDKQDQLLLEQKQNYQVQSHYTLNQMNKLFTEFEKNLANKIQSSVEHLIYERSRPSSPYPAASSTFSQQYINPQGLLNWIDIPDLMSRDIDYIDKKRYLHVSVDEQARAEQIIQCSQFKEWLVSPTSAQLLVHGNYTTERDFSGLSLFCTSFAGALAARAPRFLRVIFFCGHHKDPFEDDFTGGRAIIESFIRQLLYQHDFDVLAPASLVSEDSIRRGDIKELCTLFKWLVHQLPQDVVLVCIIDGIVFYERDLFKLSMGLVLVEILKMSNERSTQAVVKVLIKSPTRTTEVRKPLQDDFILSMEAMPRAEMVASRSRLERQLGEGFDNIPEDAEQSRRY